jgi:hypothetical protein
MSVLAPPSFSAASPAQRASLLATKLLAHGVLWLDSQGLVSPSAHRTVRFPFVFVVGNVSDEPAPRAVQEVELLIMAIDDSEPEHAIKELLTSYARFVVASDATTKARITGQTIEAWLKQR